MFNLPIIPTDSLYKFAFVSGILIILYAFYFSDNHLNHFRKSQNYHIRDSIEERFICYPQFNFKDPINENTTNLGRTIAIVDKYAIKLAAIPTSGKAGFDKDTCLIDSTDVFETISIYYSAVNTKFPEYDRLLKLDLQKFANNDNDAKEIKILQKAIYHMNSKYKRTIKDIKNLTAEINHDIFYFDALLVMGALLFVLGSLCWYFLIQKPQDELLNYQVEQSKKAINTGRKHYYPINIKVKK